MFSIRTFRSREQKVQIPEDLGSTALRLAALQRLNTQRPQVTVILKYTGIMAPMALILLAVGGAKAELVQALVPCEIGVM